MRISYIGCGLANQMFQYIFTRYAERKFPGTPWVYDDSFFFVENVHNGYELEKIFGLKLNLLSRYFDQDVWGEIIRLRKQNVKLAQIILNMGVPISMVAENIDYGPFDGKVIQVGVSEFRPDILELPDENIYYHGYWICKDWFDAYKEENLAELAFPPLTDDQNRRFSDMINSSPSVGIHIRRRDFVQIGWALPPEYYKKACKLMIDFHPESHFFVFSDDIEWCKANAEELGLNLASRTTYITGNTHGKNYIDMQLFSMCKGMIMSNSSFCYLGTLMNQNLEFCINPTPYKL